MNDELQPRFAVKGDVIFPPDSANVIGCFATHARMFDAVTGAERFRFKQAKQIRGHAFLPDQEHVVLAEMHAHAGVYSLADGSRVGKKWKLTNKHQEIEAFLHLPASERMIYAAGSGELLIRDHAGAPAGTIGYSSHKPWGVIPNVLAASPAEKLLAVGWLTARPLCEVAVSILEWPSGKVLRQFSPCESLGQTPDSTAALVQRLVFLDDETLYVASREAAGCFDVTTGQLRPEFGVRGRNTYVVRLNHSDHFLVSEAGRIEHWNCAPLVQLGQFPMHPQYAVAHLISPDDSLVAIGGRSRDGNEIFELEAILRKLRPA